MKEDAGRRVVLRCPSSTTSTFWFSLGDAKGEGKQREEVKKRQVKRAADEKPKGQVGKEQLKEAVKLEAERERPKERGKLKEAAEKRS